MSISSRKTRIGVDKRFHEMQNSSWIVQSRKGSKKVWPKGDRGLGKQGSKVVLEKTGVFIPAGSGKILLTFNFIYIIYKFAKYQFILFYMSWFIRNLQNMPQYRQEL